MRRAVLALLVGAVLLGQAATSASAADGRRIDDSGDAPARIDITQLTVDNDRRWFSMKIKVRNLREKGRFQFDYQRERAIGPDRPHPGAIVIVHRVNGKTHARWFGCGLEDCDRDPCARLRVLWRADIDIVRIAAPHNCLWWLRQIPEATPPSRGTFSVYSWLGRDQDVTDSTDPIVVDRG